MCGLRADVEKQILLAVSLPDALESNIIAYKLYRVKRARQQGIIYRTCFRF